MPPAQPAACIPAIGSFAGAKNRERVGPQAEPTLSLFKRDYIYTKQPSSSSVRSSRTCLICCSCERGQISRASGVSTTI